jgi:hypothetical protein
MFLPFLAIIICWITKIRWKVLWSCKSHLPNVAESRSKMWLLVSCILAIYTASIFGAAASGRSVEDLVGVFSIQKTIKLGSSSECFKGSQSSADSLSLQNNDLADYSLADNQPPGLAGLNIEPKAINASSSRSINLTAHIIDDQSGLAEGSGSNVSTAWFVSPSGRQVIGAAFVPDDLTSGNKLDGFYKGLIVLPKNSEIGTWRLCNLTLIDVQGNRRVIGRDQILRLGLGFQAEFLVT